RRIHTLPFRPLVEKLWPREPEQQNRSRGQLLCDVLDEVEEGGFGPVKVLEDDQDRLLVGEGLEEAANGPECLAARACAVLLYRQLGNPCHDQPAVLIAGKQRPEVGPSLDLADDLTHRHERRSLPVRDAASAEDGGGAVERRRQLGRKPCLADPGFSDDQLKTASSVPCGAFEGFAERRELPAASDKGC